MDSKKILTNTLRIKKIALWSAVTCGCVIWLNIFWQLHMEKRAQDTEMFIPGLLALYAATLLVLIYAVTRIIKYIKMFWQQ